MQATFDWKFNLGNQVEQIEARAFPTSDTIKLQAWKIKSKSSCKKDFHNYQIKYVLNLASLCVVVSNIYLLIFNKLYGS